MQSENHTDLSSPEKSKPHRKTPMEFFIIANFSSSYSSIFMFTPLPPLHLISKSPSSINLFPNSCHLNPFHQEQHLNCVKAQETQTTKPKNTGQKRNRHRNRNHQKWKPNSLNTGEDDRQFRGLDRQL